jgi:hypothetical protein
MNLELGFAEGRAGMNRVAANNEALHKGWQDLASAFLESYARRHPHFFPHELTEAFAKSGNVQPHDERAWGAVYQRAAKAKRIVRSRQSAPHPKRHGVVVFGWDSLIHKEAV